MLAATVCTTGCKDDSEDDLNVGPSDVAGVFINEVCSSGTDWIELYNASDEAVSLGGFHLQDSKGSEEEYVFPADTKIAAHGYLVLEKDADFSFGISGDGDEIKLLDAAYKPVDDVVVGDKVLLQSGDKVPADGVLIHGTLKVDNSALNGEAEECPKTAADESFPLPEDITGDTQTPPQVTGGGTYARMFKNHVAFGPLFPTDPPLTEGVGTLHQNNEAIAVDHLVEVCAIYARLLYEIMS